MAARDDSRASSVFRAFGAFRSFGVLRKRVSSMNPTECSADGCAQCRHAQGGGARLEQATPGLAVLGSGYGASVADSMLCGRLDRWVGPADMCGAYEAAAPRSTCGANG